MDIKIAERNTYWNIDFFENILGFFFFFFFFFSFFIFAIQLWSYPVVLSKIYMIVCLGNQDIL